MVPKTFWALVDGGYLLLVVAQPFFTRLAYCDASSSAPYCAWLRAFSVLTFAVASSTMTPTLRVGVSCLVAGLEPSLLLNLPRSVSFA